MKPLIKHSKRTLIGFIGGLVVLVGMVMIPYPGPGWLVVFLGLGILATEFNWARRLLRYGKRRYQDWHQWVKRQPLFFRLFLWAFTAAVVIVTIWLANGYGMINAWLELDQDWLRSPIQALEFLEN